MYENLAMRNEFQKSLHNYAICVFQKLDLNRIKDLLIKFNLLEGITKEGHFFVNKEETLKSMLSNIDSETCQNLEIHEDFKDQIQSTVQHKKTRQKTGIDHQKTFCGMEKMQIFKKIILPVLKTIADGVNFNIINLIQEIIGQICMLDQVHKVDEEHAQNEDIIEKKASVIKQVSNHLVLDKKM